MYLIDLPFKNAIRDKILIKTFINVLLQLTNKKKLFKLELVKKLRYIIVRSKILYTYFIVTLKKKICMHVYWSKREPPLSCIWFKFFE